MHDKEFFDIVRKDIFRGRMGQEQVEGVKLLLSAFEKAQWPRSWRAYGLATTALETAYTMQPIRERGPNEYFTRMYDITGQRPDLARRNGNTTKGDGIKYRGRGFVQITWKTNYKKASDLVGIDLVKEPDRALEPDVSVLILIDGMSKGWFTGRALGRYLKTNHESLSDEDKLKAYSEARRVINGKDRADEIARMALVFEKALATIEEEVEEKVEKAEEKTPTEETKPSEKVDVNTGGMIRQGVNAVLSGTGITALLAADWKTAGIVIFGIIVAVSLFGFYKSMGKKA